MARPEKLSEDAIKSSMETLSGWEFVEGREAIKKTFVFKNFVEAFGFMTKIAIRAEKLDHHPEWFNVYKTVDVTLATHDVDGLSELDFKLARHMDKAASS